jgi:molybdate transport system substrate-binding protein
MKKAFFALTAATLCAAFFTGCGDSKKTQSPPAETKPVALNIFAAASLTEALTEIAMQYKTAAPAVTLTFNFDSAGRLQIQIENGAEADVFISAGQKQMNELAAGGRINADTRRNVLGNKIVLIVPENSAKVITSFQDCLTPKVSLIAMGNPSTPLSQYGEEIFKFLNGWEIVTAKASLGATVKEVVSQVQSGSVDCGLVFSTDAATAKGVKVVAYAPEGSHQPVLYPAAVLKESANAEAAKAFLDYLSSPDAVKVFERIGFATVK